MPSPYFMNKPLLEYAEELAEEAHRGVKRDTGEPYISHPKEVAGIMAEVLLDTRFRNAALAAAYLHDAVEDSAGYDVYDPLKYDPRVYFNKKKGATYLNDLLLLGGEESTWVCYIVNKVTFREGASYSEYMDKIFDFFRIQGFTRSLDVISAITKFADRTVNCIPREKLNPDSLIEEYRELKDADEKALQEFYTNKKITDIFMKTGGIRYDEELFIYAAEDKFESKKLANALDNLLSYIPKIEKKLMFKSTDVAAEDDRRLFNFERLSVLIDQCMWNSFEIVEHADFSDRLKLVHVLYRTGNYRGKVPEQDYIHKLKAMRLKAREKA